MEADWEVEIGPGAPLIDACWAGFVDLRNEPAPARQLPEAAILPALADALMKLNSFPSSEAIWTAKCDVWQIDDPLTIDADELDATPTEAAYAWGCYIDLLPSQNLRWNQVTKQDSDTAASLPEAAIAWCKSVCKQLRAYPLSRCRADLIVRKAIITPRTTDIGITAYLTACGATSTGAKLHLNTVLEQVASGIADGFAPQAKVE